MEPSRGYSIMINFNFSWLPELIKYDSKTSWDDYIESIYRHFKREFIDSKPIFKGETLALKKHPGRNGKEATFYHITTEGEDEDAREFDPLRCERARWPKAIIEDDYVGLKIWENTRYNKKNIVIWL